MNSKKNINIYWSRRDFRLHDNPALYHAVKNSATEHADFLPVFVLEDYMFNDNPIFQFGHPSRVMISHTVPYFFEKFEKSICVKGKGAESIISLLKKLSSHYSGITVYVNEDVYIDFYKQIKKIQKYEINIMIYKDRLTIPRDTKTGQGNYYSIFTPFKRSVMQLFLESCTLPNLSLAKLLYPSKKVLDAISRTIPLTYESIRGNFSMNRILKIGTFTLDINSHIPHFPTFETSHFTEEYARKHIKKFIMEKVRNYETDRNMMGIIGTSHISYSLSWGLISAREIKNIIIQEFSQSNIGAETYISELIWREFYAYLLFQSPRLLSEEFQTKYRNIPWDTSKIAFKNFISWIKGETGYPIVDAAMKEITCTGYMHNRARMIVSSFLTKHLGIDWRWGQEYFRAMLVDIDEASNCGGWQWGASVGADPKPIRIFNPELQQKNYDPDYVYIRKFIGADFDPKSYIKPLIDHKLARAQALSRYKI